MTTKTIEEMKIRLAKLSVHPMQNKNLINKCKRIIRKKISIAQIGD